MIFITGQKASVPQSERGAHTHTQTHTHINTHTHRHTLMKTTQGAKPFQEINIGKRRFFISKMICSINLTLCVCERERGRKRAYVNLEVLLYLE